MLHHNLQKKVFIGELPLSTILMEDNHHYPWLFLVPKRENIFKIIDLSITDQIQLTKELDYIQKMMWEIFQPKQLNVAAIGNKTPQLHIHVIARFETDPAWPNTVWDHPVKEKMNVDEYNRRKDLFIKMVASANV
jgi:diadenosine tetraphosphate (Ap4A) HIT family hydrolase